MKDEKYLKLMGFTEGGEWMQKKIPHRFLKFCTVEIDLADTLYVLTTDINDEEQAICAKPYTPENLNDLLEWLTGKKVKAKRVSKEFAPPTYEEFEAYCRENKHHHIARRAFTGYDVAGWKDSSGKAIRSWKQKLHHVWFKDGDKPEVQSRASALNNL